MLAARLSFSAAPKVATEYPVILRSPRRTDGCGTNPMPPPSPPTTPTVDVPLGEEERTESVASYFCWMLDIWDIMCTTMKYTKSRCPTKRHAPTIRGTVTHRRGWAATPSLRCSPPALPAPAPSTPASGCTAAFFPPFFREGLSRCSLSVCSDVLPLAASPPATPGSGSGGHTLPPASL